MSGSRQHSYQAKLMNQSLKVFNLLLALELWTNLKSLSSKPKLYEKRLKNRESLLNTLKKAVVYYGKLEEYKIQSEIEVLAMKVIHNDCNEKLDLLNVKNKDEQKKQSKKKKM